MLFTGTTRYFEAFGYEIPTTWEELGALVEQMVADGNVPWSMGLESEAATGWTGSDFIQDILLVQQGPEYVMSIIGGEIPYNDVGVAQAYETYGKWAKDPQYIVGGAQGTLTTGFRDAIFDIVTDTPDAMMVKQSGFAGGDMPRSTLIRSTAPTMTSSRCPAFKVCKADRTG